MKAKNKLAIVGIVFLIIGVLIFILIKSMKQ